MLAPPAAGAGAALLAAGLFGVLLAENCRVPFDDPNTHLELTMIHEVMVLDHSGPPLAAILHGASLKLLLFAVLLAEAVLPLGRLSLLPAIAALLAFRCWSSPWRWAWLNPAGAAGVSPRAAAADHVVFAVPVRPAGGVEGRPAMSGALNLLIGLAMGLSLLALASSRLPSVIRAAAFQGMVLGMLPLLLEQEFQWLVVAVAVGTIAVKGFVIPHLLRRALRAANIDREVEPLIGFVPSLLLGAAATIGAAALGGDAAVAARTRRIAAGARLVRHRGGRLYHADGPHQGHLAGLRLFDPGKRHLPVRPAAHQLHPAAGGGGNFARPHGGGVRHRHHHGPDSKANSTRWTPNN